MAQQTLRRRSSSIAEVYQYLKEPGVNHHLQHLQHLKIDTTHLDVPTPLPPPETPRPRKKAPATAPLSPTLHGPTYLHWVQRPGDSFIILATIVSCWCAWEIVFPPSKAADAPLGTTNPFAPFLFISYPLPHREGDPVGMVRYAKGVKDLLFLPFWIVAFSFVRQAVTLHVVRPLGKRLGIKSGRKMERFMEQVSALWILYLEEGKARANASMAGVGICGRLLWLLECLRTGT